MKTYRDLKVWQKSMTLVEYIYRNSKDYPKEELCALTSQIRRSAVSIPSNIAEGYGRNSSNDYIWFLHIACGSLYEFQTQLEISRRLEYIEDGLINEMNSLSIEIEKMLSCLIRKVKENKR